MTRALRLAEHGRYTTHPNPRVGCVVVKDGKVVGEGYHRRAGESHAETIAMGHAGPACENATLYVTLEPCRHRGRTPPCTAAIIAAGIGRVVAAMRDPDPKMSGHGLSELASAGLRTEFGLLEREARALNAGFVSRMERDRPFVRIKLAMSLDGRTAMASGESRWITGPAARRDVQHWRASSDAIVTGIGTVLADDPSLNVRPVDMGDRAPLLGEPLRHPIRVIMDSSLKTPTTARLFQFDGPVLIATARQLDTETTTHYGPTTEIVVLQRQKGRPSPGKLLSMLAERNINEVLVEAGPTLAGTFMADHLVDELLVYAAPTLLGSAARPLLDLPGLQRMSEQIRLQILEVRHVGDDLRIRARPAGSSEG